jgi:hypothetical protein
MRREKFCGIFAQGTKCEASNKPLLRTSRVGKKKKTHVTRCFLIGPRELQWNACFEAFFYVGSYPWFFHGGQRDEQVILERVFLRK